jgi:predicted amidohydrolase
MGLAETLDGQTAQMIGEKCQQHSLYAIVGMALRNPALSGAIYNCGVLFGPDGRVQGVYTKTHIAAEEKHYFIPGDYLPVFDTDVGKMGIMICYDSLFPEVARVMTLKGADILIAIFNSPMMDIYLNERYAHLASVRAWENKNFVICCNRVGEQAGWKWLGHSAMASAAGQVLAYSDTDQEEIISARFEAKQILEERAYLTTYRDRRPDLYGELTLPLTAGINGQWPSSLSRIQKNT